MIYFKLLNVPLLNVINLKYLLRVSNFIDARSKGQNHANIKNLELMPIVIISNFDSTRGGR